MTTTDTTRYACAACGHDKDAHYWDLCLGCNQHLMYCECDDDACMPYEGCDQCNSCEGFKKPKADQASTAADADQPTLFDAADA